MGNRLDDGVCLACGEAMLVERLDGVPLHAECEKEIRAKARRIKERQSAGLKCSSGLPHLKIARVVMPK